MYVIGVTEPTEINKVFRIYLVVQMDIITM